MRPLRIPYLNFSLKTKVGSTAAFAAAVGRASLRNFRSRDLRFINDPPRLFGRFMKSGALAFEHPLLITTWHCLYTVAMRDLRDRVIIITGASSGIGAATAIASAKAGMHVVINARRADRLAEVATQIESHHRQSAIVAGDVTEPGISQRMLDVAMERFGRFDAVFANAGYGYDRSVIELTDRELRDMFEVNFFAGVDLLRQAATRLIATRREGVLLMCSSCLAKFTLPNSGTYCATKAAQNHICRAMNLELRRHNIHVASVHPIGTRTEFFHASSKRSGKPDESQRIIERTPRLFMQPPERVANAVVRCLRRPRPEVWTSFPMRFIAGITTIWPRLGDFAMRQADKRMSEM
jgi:short-subunit dehydrogenase